MYGHLYLTKGHLENPEGSMEVEFSYGMFLTHFVLFFFLGGGGGGGLKKKKKIY